jgi:hypothetical protein
MARGKNPLWSDEGDHDPPEWMHWIDLVRTTIA